MAAPRMPEYARQIRESLIEPSNRTTREKWLAHLGLLCAASQATDSAADMKVRIYAEMLADIPAVCWTADTLERVARANKFFPSYADLRAALEGFVNNARSLADRLDWIAKRAGPIEVKEGAA